MGHAEHAGTARGRPADDILGRHDTRTLHCAVGVPGAVHFAEHIRRFIGGCSVNTERDGTTEARHRVGGRDAGAEASVGLQSMRHPGTGACENVHLLLVEMDQMRKPTAAHFNRTVYERLKPSESYVIVADAAAVGAGTSDAQSLHRIESASVREEVEAAGFVLDAESTMLANKDDPHSIKVLDPSTKGETDRFAYRFVKP
ncbi:putative methyltransferase [Bradyrhizobium japonicum]|uniref:Methyltransferase n=1 Tax=Bradyrhizobium ottawaense TaxID=931866 RepID=A0ABV4FJE0_9BRAD|nr:putative methyltransferase [Bradyrhizobium elkanii]MCS3576102.1 putative methyltransferase [Bradyrhizobium elkanii]MCS3594563.1 putative methyltransferase [Bradyrhizobium elkanii]MCS3626152.1 putative methyltransferase [Bradyrhizobium elkanii]